MGKPDMPPPPTPPPPAVDVTDKAIQNARTMERRKQLGLQGRMSTFLTTRQGGETQASPTAAPTPKTYLGQ